MSVFNLSAALHRDVIPWRELDWPLDWDRHFGRVAPLRVEVGFGNGEFLQSLALDDPTSNHVGIEVSWVSIHRLLKRIHHNEIGNVRGLLGDGGFLLEHAFAHESLASITLNHPDPWPKKRHHNRRLIQAPFLTMLAHRLTADGTVTIQTDHADYAQWIAEALAGQDALAPVEGQAHLSRGEGQASTKYERRGREAGYRIHTFIWKRALRTGAVAPPPEETGPMPNVLLQGPLGDDALLKDFSRVTWRDTYRGAEVILQLERLYRNEDHRDWLFEARVQEGPFTQHFAMQVTARPDGTLLIKPGAIGHPRPTYGVKELVRRTAGLIAQAHPELGVHSSSVGDPLQPSPPVSTA